jgi:hypothetical protein
MIHRILVGPDTRVDELKKLVRKRLMTGGAVLRIAEDVTAGDLRAIVAEFAPGAESHGVQAAVLAEAARHPALPLELAALLRALGLPEVERAFLAGSRDETILSEERSGIRSAGSAPD